MYCRNCGQKLADGDKFCSSCGEKTILASENDKPENLAADAEEKTSHAQAEGQPEEKAPLFEPFDFKSLDLGIDLGLDDSAGKSKESGSVTPPVEDFDWNIHTFPGQRVEKTEEIDFNWSMSPEELEAAQHRSAPAQTHTAETKPAGEIVQETINSADAKPQPASETIKQPDEGQKPQAASSLEEELFGGLDSKADEARKQSEQIDKFFTFNKKNEEFQKLLDREYEKIKSGNILSEEMNTAAAASEEKFASRKPEDPMEELFAAEGVVKSYEPKPVETDVLDRIEAAEAEKKAREEAARIIEEEKAKAREEEAAKAKAEAEALAKAQAAEEAARLRLEEEAKRAADARAAQEAAEREKERAAAREDTEAAMKAEAEKARIAQEEAEAKLAQEAARLRAEAEARAKAEAEAKAKAEAEAKAAAEARAKAEAQAKAREEAIARAKAEEEAKAAAAKAAEEDPLNHISEMVRARETFFGQQSLEDALKENEPLQEEQPIPEKTKAVDKAAILAGMATASEMVQRDRQAAAAEAAAKVAPQEEIPVEDFASEPVDMPDFLGHFEEEPAASVPAADTIEEIDILDELQDLSVEAEPARSAEELEEIPAELFSFDDLMGEEAQDPAPDEPAAEAKPVSDETLIMSEESVADILNNQTEPAQQPMDATMVFPSDYSPAEDISEAIEQTGIADHMEFEDEEDEDEEEKGGKGRVVLKVFLVILIILLAIEIAGVVIKLTAPNSGAAKFIDSQLNKVIHLFTGNDAEYTFAMEKEDIREEPMEDKTTLIQAEMGKNKDGNIAAIEYNADLKFDPDKKYENQDLNLTQKLADVTWYKDAENKQVYYDQAIVGAIIAYDSQKVNLINNNDTSVLNLMQQGTDLYKEVKQLGKKGMKETFKTLKIGEIRQVGSSYFVWVSEKVSDTQNGSKQNSTTKRIYELQPDNEIMKVVASYEI
ncbi:MAG: zinc ribbon domain-containing protein [Clostridiales Family XIII bacterium]|nr:zinc ribbon domain-containing protein [Clostridia bacterium]MDY3012354.1 zinc ribbon domain-containing protein [Clostridiales Family XIII bacterium]